jgi:hypothetical protein
MAPNRSYYQYYTFCGFNIFYLRVKILLYINKLLCYWCGVVDGDFYSKRYLNISAKFHTSMFGYQHSICTFMFSLKKFLVSLWMLVTVRSRLNVSTKMDIIDSSGRGLRIRSGIAWISILANSRVFCTYCF